MLLVTTIVLVVMICSVMTHAELLAYGLRTDVRKVPLAAAGAGGVAVLCALSGGFLCGRKTRRIWVSLAGLSVGSLCLATALVCVYGLEVKYEQGDSNLKRVARYASDLGTWTNRAATVRAGILEGAELNPIPEHTPLRAVRHSHRECRGYAVENVYFESIPGFFVAGNLYSPASGGGRKPVILIPHGHFREGRFGPELQQLAATFARMGALAFTYDMVGRGESRQVAHKNPHTLTLQLWNSIRALDFLLALPDADPSRVGMTGASGGGTQTFLCTAVDERVTVCAPVVIVASWTYGGCLCEIGMPVHRGAGYASNNAEIAALAAPRPELLVSVGKDWSYTTPRLEFPYLRAIYRLYGQEQNVQNEHFSTEGHDYGPSKREAVYRFFSEHLGLQIGSVRLKNGHVDETPNAVLPRTDLESFDAAHLLPPKALQGWDAVLAALKALQKGS
jgi:hypothetical protein